MESDLTQTKKTQPTKLPPAPPPAFLENLKEQRTFLKERELFPKKMLEIS